MEKNMQIGIVAIAIVLLLVVGWAIFANPNETGAVTNASGDEYKIKYGGQYYPGEFLLKGNPETWEEYGLQVEHTLFSSGSENNKAMISGDVDINVGSDSKTVAIFNAIPDQALIIGTVQRGNRYTTIVRADSDYESWDDLKGKKVATRFGTGAESILRKYYEQEGYEWEDFEYVNLNVEDMISALKAGQIEAFTVWAPTPEIAEAQGVGKALRSYGDIAPVPVSIHTTKDFAYNNREAVVRFLAAQLDKAELIENNPKKAAEYAAQAAADKGVNVSPTAFEKVYNRIDFTIESDQEMLDSIMETAEFLKEQGKIEKIPELAWDNSFLEEAKAMREK